MSITQTYYLAHSARGKLSSEAARADHNLRLLVGHANLLDSLMIELAEAEQEQESWFNQSVNGATREESPKHIKWADAIIEESEEDWQADDMDSSSESEEEDDFMEDDLLEMRASGFAPLRRVTSHTTISEIEPDDEEDTDDAEDYAALTLTRSPSHSTQLPELISHDLGDDSSDDESMPPSPPTTAMPTFSEKQRQQIATTSFYDSRQSQSKPSRPEQSAFFDVEYYDVPQRGAANPSAISVY